MYKTKLTANQHLIEVESKNGKIFNYSTNNSLANPLEATFAAINGCAGVFAIKACQKLNLSAEGIEIETIPKNNKDISLNIFGVNSFVTKIKFPNIFTKEQQQTIIESIEHCAVKELIKNGQHINFNIEIID